jgi:CubicO group peptidase (beta-lactamase class C family)
VRAPRPRPAVSEDRLVGGVVIVATDGEQTIEAVAGLADREAGRRMPIVAAAAMALIERGTIRLDDPVTRWLPEFAPKLAGGAATRIEVRHLLTHTAGLDYAMLQPPGGTYEGMAGGFVGQLMRSIYSK